MELHYNREIAKALNLIPAVEAYVRNYDSIDRPYAAVERELANPNEGRARTRIIDRCKGNEKHIRIFSYVTGNSKFFFVTLRKLNRHD